jgi:hypothetical protein
MYKPVSDNDSIMQTKGNTYISHRAEAKKNENNFKLQTYLFALDDANYSKRPLQSELRSAQIPF